VKRQVHEALRMLSLGGVLACSGELGHKAADLFPILRKTRPELAYDPVDCEDDYDTPKASGCVMEKIDCGDEIEGYTGDGFEKFSDAFYTADQHWCTPFKEGYDKSKEVVYELELPEQTHAELTLISPCTDLDLAAFAWDDGANRCPGPKDRIGACEMSVQESAVDQVVVETTTIYDADTKKFLVVIDGKDDESANFRLEVQCRNR
jgi:hypothetical protein